MSTLDHSLDKPDLPARIVFLQTFTDCDTAYRLELVTSTRGTNKKASLFGILNHCITNCGKRFLRSSILQPLCSELLIDQRLQAVEELATNPDLLSSLQVP